MLERICIVGSGNWGSAIAKVIGNNILRHPNIFEKNVKMWVFEENFNGRLLTDWINKSHINPKYLPDILLPENVVAEPDLLKAVDGSSLLVFVLPHQFVRKICEDLRGHISPKARAISLIKGLDASSTGLSLISELIHTTLSIPVSVLMGANIANEVAKEQFCEATIGCAQPENAKIWKLVFNTSYFLINTIDDVEGVELCGALKNIVAVAAGFIDGLGLGDNTKAAVIRIGLVEMKKFTELFHAVRSASGTTKYSNPTPKWETFFESCGVADLITTCSAGRNRKLAEAFVKTGKSFEQLEVELLNGQKLQGPPTAKEVHEILSRKGKTSDFPLFTAVYKICYENCPVMSLMEQLSVWSNNHHSSNFLSEGRRGHDHHHSSDGSKL